MSTCAVSSRGRQARAVVVVKAPVEHVPPDLRSRRKRSWGDVRPAKVSEGLVLKERKEVALVCRGKWMVAHLVCGEVRDEPHGQAQRVQHQQEPEATSQP